MKLITFFLLLISTFTIYASDKNSSLGDLIEQRDSLKKELVSTNELIAKKLAAVASRGELVETDSNLEEREVLRKKRVPRLFREQQLMSKYFAEKRAKDAEKTKIKVKAE